MKGTGDKSKLWQIGEEHAAHHLKRLGYRIIERNWRSGKYGELDIIARDPDGVYVFIEVKTRRTTDENGNRLDIGFQAVTGIKQHKVVRLALRYLSSRFLTVETVQCRFDVIVVHLPYTPWNDTSEVAPEIVHVKDAFHNLSWA